jgi:WD40 repeat protein
MSIGGLALGFVLWSPGKHEREALPLEPQSHPVTAVESAVPEISKELLTLRGHVDEVATVAWSPDGRRLATGSFDGRAKIWDAETGKELLTLLTPGGKFVWSVAWSPDGKRLATGNTNGTAHVWDVVSGKELLTLSAGPVTASTDLAWSPDGKRLATAGEKVKVWDAERGKELLTLSSLVSGGVSWSPDRKRLTMWVYAGTPKESDIKMWDAETEKEVLTFRGGGYVYIVAWSPDGKRLATGSEDAMARVWDLAR